MERRPPMLVVAGNGKHSRSIMPLNYKTLITLTFSLALTACGGHDSETAPPPPPEAETAAEQPEAPLRSEPADEPPPPIEPEAAAGADPEALEQARAERQALRERRQAGSGWWTDEALAERLGLDPEQRTAVLEAREALMAARLEGRTRLQQQQVTMRAAEQTQESERLAELRASRDEIVAGLDDAEQAWQATLRDVLNTEQLERLRQEQPKALEPGPTD